MIPVFPVLVPLAVSVETRADQAGDDGTEGSVSQSVSPIFSHFTRIMTQPKGVRTRY